MAVRVEYFPDLCRERLAETEMEVLVTKDRTVAVPILDHLIFFNEADFFSPPLLAKKIQHLQQQLAADELRYERFVRQKSRRANYDLYACFQPFNEALKAFFPFLKTLKERLLPGAVILNLWDRTGYTACLLAGLFPEQRVINIWEGDKDTLGYQGFQFWYRDEPKESNPIQITFADLSAALPFTDDSVSLVVGLDTLHRFPQTHLLRELFRIVQPEGVILLPHVHLTNAEPEPFFERGCRQLHGTDYDAFFQSAAVTGRRGYLLPEPEMFLFNELSDEQEQPLYSAPDSEHYNTSVAIVPATWDTEERLRPFRFDDLPDPVNARILINPLLEVDWRQQEVRQNPDHLDGQVGYLLERHPVYLKKLATRIILSELELKILYWAERLFTVQEIATRLAVTETEVLDRLRQLQAQDVVQLVPLREQHLRLQYFVSTQTYRVPYAAQNLRTLWDRAQRHFAEHPYLFSEADDSELTYAEADELVQMIRQALYVGGLRAGDHVVLVAKKHFESILTVQAATHAGMVIVPLDPELPAEVIEEIIDRVAPRLVLTDQLHAVRLRGKPLPVVQLDDEEATTDLLLFSDWLEKNNEEEAVTVPDYVPKADEVACVLFTSGSTGRPKGVPLTHGQLFRSGRLITETFHWRAEDRFFSPGELDSMSGFRNYCVAPLEVGAAIILPAATSGSHLFSLVETIDRYQATLLGTTPPLLTQLVRYHKRLAAQLNSVKTVICTGSNLADETKHQCQELFDWTVLNYYGLTETTGICLAEDPDDYQLNGSTVGIPRAAIAQIVNEDEEVVGPGEQGELRIYSENIAGRYLGDPQHELLRNGWLYTGDIARWEDNGHLALLGRSRQIIKLPSGQLVFASEIENQLLVARDLVANAAVAGYSDEAGIERIAAFVQLRDASHDPEEAGTELRRRLQDKLGERKVPQRWFFVDRLPVNSSGKIQKKDLIKQHLSQ